MIYLGLALLGGSHRPLPWFIFAWVVRSPFNCPACHLTTDHFDISVGQICKETARAYICMPGTAVSFTVHVRPGRGAALKHPSTGIQNMQFSRKTWFKLFTEKDRDLLRDRSLLAQRKF